MRTPENFEIAESHACFRPVGEVSLKQAIGMVCEIITFAGDHQIKKLLVDTSKLTGIEPLTTMERFTMGASFAKAQTAPVKLALVARADLIDPRRFGVTVARNRGLVANVFTSETDALEWLMDPRAQ